MTTLIDLKKSINQVLKDNFPNIKIYPSETKEGFQRPAFFTQVIPVTTEYETVNFSSNIVMIVINYFSKNGTEIENLKMDDELRKAFKMTLKVNQRSLLLKNIRSEIVDEVLQFRFDLNYFVDIEKIDEHEIMQELNTEIIKEE
jgi:hypothetical protein